MSDETSTELHTRVAGLRDALTLAGERLPVEVERAATADLDRVVRRLELGVHHTVVALVGGTGSGKSSTFNALTRLDFADVGVIRPTTSQASACTWHTAAHPLLDFLGVHAERRISRESALTGDDEAEFSGLVLLDLPDHDSINPENAALVDRLLPMIDLLIWVLDPQKYADNVLHEKYLQQLTDRHEAMLVVVNQVDTVPDSGLDQIRSDVKRLLAEDNLQDVPVILASATTGHGMGVIRQHIAEKITVESIAARTARDELRAISRRLRGSLAEATPALPQTAHVTAELASAAGVPAVGESIRVAVAGAGSAALSKVQAPASSRVEAIRETWLEQVAGTLPLLWREHLASVISPREAFYQHITQGLESVKPPGAVDLRAKMLRLLGYAFLVVGVLLAGLGAILDANVPLLITGGALAVIGAIAVLVARFLRISTARQRSQTYLNDVALNLSRVVHGDLEEPARAELDIHASVLAATEL